MNNYSIKECPISSNIQLFGSQWSFFLLVELRKNPASFSQLKKNLKPITGKMLSLALQKAIKASHVQKQDKIYSISNNGIKLFDALKNSIEPTKLCNNCTGNNVCMI